MRVKILNIKRVCKLTYFKTIICEIYLSSPINCVSDSIILRGNVTISIESEASIRLLQVISVSDKCLGAEYLTSLNQIFI
jgi:hypothetical protein